MISEDKWMTMARAVHEDVLNNAMQLLSANCNAHWDCEGCKFSISEEDWICLLKDVFPGEWMEVYLGKESLSCKSTSEE